MPLFWWTIFCILRLISQCLQRSSDIWLWLQQSGVWLGFIKLFINSFIMNTMKVMTDNHTKPLMHLIPSWLIQWTALKSTYQQAITLSNFSWNLCWHKSYNSFKHMGEGSLGLIVKNWTGVTKFVGSEIWELDSYIYSPLCITIDM